MFNETAKPIFANLGLATVARNKLTKSNPDVAYDLVKVPTGVQVVRSTPVDPVVVVPQFKMEAQPVAADETVKFVVRVRSMSDKWITLCEPMPNGTIWVYRPYVLAINHLPDSDSAEIAVALKVAKKKGWAA
jgi:hypothetical protein